MRFKSVKPATAAVAERAVIGGEGSAAREREISWRRHVRASLLLAACLSVSAWGAGNNLVISEFMAVNTRTLADEDGDYPDWIEIHNPTAVAVNLEGWYLTDQSDHPTKWRFPDVTLPAGGFLVVYASDKDRRDPARALHANFKLTSEGEYLALVGPDGTTVISAFAPTFPPQLPDISYGYQTSSAGERVLVSSNAPLRFRVANGPLPPDWRQPEFVPDTNWMEGCLGIGFEVASLAPPARILFVVNTNAAAAGKAGDQAVVDRLRLIWGHQVTVAHDSASSTSQTNGHDLVLISSTVASGSVNTKFRDVALPVIQGEAALADDFLLSASGANLSGQTTLNITAAGAAHPLGAGLPPGGRQIRASATTFHVASATSLAAGAVVVAEAPNGAPAVLVVDKGAKLNNGVAAPGVRIHLCFGDEGVNGVNESGLALFDAAINYALLGGGDARRYADLIQTDLRNAMHPRHSSALARLVFSPADLGRLDSLELRIRYNDGFVAWLNGSEIARRNAPATVDWNATALSARPPAQSAVPEVIPLPDGVSMLNPDINVLACQVLNVSTNDGDLLLAPELVGRGSWTTPQYYVSPTPGASNTAGTLGLVPPVQFSVHRGFFHEPFQVGLTNPLAGAEIRYTTNGSAPTATSGFVYSQPILISGSTVLRAAAFRPGYFTSNAVAMTYLFPEQVLRQPLAVPGWPRPVQSTGQGSAQHDYEMAPAIVDHPAYSNDIRAALTAIPTMSLAVAQADMWDAAGNGGFYRLFDVEKPVSVELFFPGAPHKDVLAHGSVQGHSHDRIKRSLRLSFNAAYGDTKFVSSLFRDGPLANGQEDGKVDNIILRGGNNRCWARSWNPDRSTYTEDEWYRATQAAMSGVGTVGHFVHLYINGLYWGLYNPVQRPDADFAAHHFGGEKEDWFSVSHSGEHGGDAARWNYLKGALAAKDMTVAANYAELCAYLEPGQFIDYLLLSWYIGMGDWPANNWWAAMRVNPPGPARFFAWDGEWCWGVGNGSAAEARVHPDFKAGATSTAVLPTLWRAARRNADFMMLVADRAFRHTAGQGALSDASAQNRWQMLSNYLWLPIVAESARWGDTIASPPRNRNGDWLNEVNRISGLMAGNGLRLLASLRAEGYYPSLDPPQFEQPGGYVSPGFSLVLTNPNGAGQIYFTMDGSDPRLPGGALNAAALAYVAPAPLSHSVVVKTRIRQGAVWSALNEAAFIAPGAPPLRVTEIMYNPGPPTPLERAAGFTNENDFEYIELENIGTESLGLDGMRFVQGIDYAFANRALAPGARLLLARNQAALAWRYGAGVVADGEYEGSLDNSGERIKLVNAFDQTIHDFVYNDAWHPLTDGFGHSLVITDPQAGVSAWGLPQGWRPSTHAGGSPGAADPAPASQTYNDWQALHFNAEELADPLVSGPQADPDGDGRANWIEYGLASNPRQKDSDAALSVVLANGLLTLTFKRLNFARDLVYRLEVAEDLRGPWRQGSAELRQEARNVEAAHHTVQATVLLPASAAYHQFVRLSLESVGGP